MTLVGQRPVKSLSFVCLSVCLSFRLSLSFLKIGSLVFSGIVHDDSWPWYLVTEEARFLKKKILQPKLFLSLDHKFSLKLNTIIACDNV